MPPTNLFPYKFFARKQLDLAGRRNARGHITADAVVFREHPKYPLALNNHVVRSGRRSNEKVCTEEMMTMMDCLSRYNQDKTMCSQSIQRLDNQFIYIHIHI